jgi:hypothetical protein
MSLNATFDQQFNVPLSMTGTKSLVVDQIDFNTCGDCQITACDGGTIKVCAKMEIKDLVIDSLCIDGQLGCDQLVVQTGVSEGITFSDDPCDGSAPTAPRLFEDATNLTLVAPSGKNMNINTPATLNIGAVDKVNIAGFEADEENRAFLLSMNRIGGGQMHASNIGQSHSAFFPKFIPSNPLPFTFYPLNYNTNISSPKQYIIQNGWKMSCDMAPPPSGPTPVPLSFTNVFEPEFIDPGLFPYYDAVSTSQIGKVTNPIDNIFSKMVNIPRSTRFPPTGTDAAIGKAGDKAGDIVFVGDISGVLSVGGYMYYCLFDFPHPSHDIWMRVRMDSW